MQQHFLGVALEEIIYNPVASLIAGAVIGFLVSFYFSRRSSVELQGAAGDLGKDLKITRDLLVTNLRALEGASIVDPLSWKEVEGYGRLPVGISHFLSTRREGQLEFRYIVVQDEVTAGQPRVGRCACVPEQNPPSTIKL
jgi:hypothetical protein